jgi:hypothetical protein
MHKTFVGPLTLQAFQDLHFNLSDLALAASHRATLANTCIKCLIQIQEFLNLLGGGAHRYFLPSIATIEVTAVLGTMIISDNLILRHGSLRKASGSFPNLGPGLRESCVKYFEEGLGLLDLLAQRSPLALKGARIMRQLQLRIEYEERMDEPQEPSTRASERSQYFSNLGQDLSSQNASRYEEDLFSGEIPNATMDQDFLNAEWESILMGADMSWFFEDSMFQNAGVGDLGMDFGMSFRDGYT